MKAGIFPGLSMAAYLELDALSCTPVRYLIDECPRAGWWRSRMNPNRPREESAEMDAGTAAHSILLEGSRAGIVAIDPNSYPSKTGSIPKGFTNDAIKAARDKARAEGKQPILTHNLADIENMVTVAQEFIGSLQHTEPAVWRAFQDDGGNSEVSIVWDEGGLLCKMRTDRSNLDFSVVVDYKSSGMSVEPDRWARSQMSSLGHHFGSAWYRRGIRNICGIDPVLLYLCQEVEAPYLCSLIGIDPAGLSLGDEKVEYGLRAWKDCLASGLWPGYRPRVYYPTLPTWESAKWEERKSGFPYDPAVLFGERQ